MDGDKAECFAPVRPDTTLTGRTHLHDIYDKKGRSGRMIFIVVRMEVYNDADEHLATTDSRMVIKGKTGVAAIHDVEFGEELPVFEPDTRIENTTAFARSVGWGGPRFESRGRSQRAFLALWCPNYGYGFPNQRHPQLAPQGHVEHIDTVFRAPMLTVLPSSARWSPTLMKTKASSNWI